MDVQRNIPPLSEQNRQVIGAVVLAFTAVAYLGIGLLNIGAPQRPAPRILLDSDAEPTQSNEWRDFACTRNGKVISRFKQARAEFVSNDGQQSVWRVFTPANNTPSTALEVKVQPGNAVCGYVNK